MTKTITRTVKFTPATTTVRKAPKVKPVDPVAIITEQLARLNPDELLDDEAEDVLNQTPAGHYLLAIDAALESLSELTQQHAQDNWNRCGCQVCLNERSVRFMLDIVTSIVYGAAAPEELDAYERLKQQRERLAEQRQAQAGKRRRKIG
jgi:hypothetical protein